MRLRRSPHLASDVRVDDDRLVVTLTDGRELAGPLEWFPRLRDAPPAHRGKWRLIGGGRGIRWDELDEDISVEGLFHP